MIMPFTDEDEETVSNTLNMITSCENPIAVFDVLLHEYRNGADLYEALESALVESGERDNE